MNTGTAGVSVISDSFGLRAIIRKDPVSRKNVFYKTEEMGEEEILDLFDKNKQD